MEQLNERAERDAVVVSSTGEFSQLFQMLDGIPGGVFTTIGYCTAVALDKSLEKGNGVKRKNPETNRMKTYFNFSKISEIENPDEVEGVLKITAYNLHWSNTEQIKKHYSKWKADANPIRVKYGLNPIGDKEKKIYQGQGIEGGKNKDLINGYNGDNSALDGKTYSPQNGAAATASVKYYLVKADGHILREISATALEGYIVKKKDLDREALIALGADDAKIKAYTDEIAALGKFRYLNFDHTKILYAAATTDKMPVVYFNDNVALKDSKGNVVLKVDPKDLLEIAKQRYQKDLIHIDKMADDLMADAMTIGENKVNKNKILMNEDVKKMHSLIERMDNL